MNTTFGAGVKDLRRLLAPVPAGDGTGSEAFTLVLLHHAGGSAASFAPFARWLPADWNLWSVDLPGRLMATGERACRTSAEAAAYLVPELRSLLPGPYAVFGHSMGALVAFETARELSAQGLTPRWVGLSGAPAPGHRPDRAQRHLWPRDRLIAFMRGLGGTPEQVFEMPDLLELMVEVLRHDLSIVDTYEVHAGPPLQAPLTVLTGEDDPVAGPRTAAPWGERTTARTTARSWPGGHFYLFDHAQEVCAAVRDEIAAVSPAGARVPLPRSVGLPSLRST
ncbi:thioesterase II family protein [Streptomyces sp. NPDC003247]|uniref:thioesterase II family protein n=1 Tax=Streptomyces sp. NPDC003247 TaxID=3364677 RepID=UPI0036AD415E